MAVAGTCCSVCVLMESGVAEACCLFILGVMVAWRLDSTPLRVGWSRMGALWLLQLMRMGGLDTGTGRTSSAYAVGYCR